ncbi:hypothetical protein C1H46_002428 [Malus baccata]|uniref:Cupin type-1 domain-containing protein n=1 Tax=Malus baccata TaxID=106549 RepID=A0A540NLX9_MALBA|nr:hypothetical protein C1H46_002428 [Malus baccata]
MASQFLFFASLAVTFSVALASDPSSLQDFCVADATSSGSKPDIPANILARAFQVDTNTIYGLQSKF